MSAPAEVGGFVAPGFEPVAEAVAEAVRTTPSGGVVLLSPGAPSYNRYRNYEELASSYEQILADAGADLA